MEHLLNVRRTMINFYKRFESLINYILKFILGFIIFSSINKLGYAPVLTRASTVFLAALLTAVLPDTWIFILISVFISVHLFYAAPLYSILIGLLLLCLILFYIRLFPKQSYLMIALFIGFQLNMPYVVAIFAGLFVGISGIAPLIIGAYLWQFAGKLPALMATSAGDGELGLFTLPDTLSQTYINFMDAATSEHEWLYYALVFSVVAIVTAVIKSLKIDYAREIAIAVGALVSIIGFFSAIIISGIALSGVGMLFMTLLSALVVYICNFFSIVLDYSSAQNVNFQDEDYLYYVRVIPKIQVEKKAEHAQRPQPKEGAKAFANPPYRPLPKGRLPDNPSPLPKKD